MVGGGGGKVVTVFSFWLFDLVIYFLKFIVGIYLWCFFLSKYH